MRKQFGTVGESTSFAMSISRYEKTSEMYRDFKEDLWA